MKTSWDSAPMPAADVLEYASGLGGSHPLLLLDLLTERPIEIGGEKLDIVGTAALLGVPTSGRHVRDVLQCLETLRWVDGALDPSQRRQVRAHVAQFYLRRKLDRVERGVAKARRLSRSVSPRRLDVSR